MKRLSAMIPALLLLLTGCGSAPTHIEPQPVEVYSIPDGASSKYADRADSEAPEETPQETSLADGMTLDQKICQLFIVTPESLTGVDVVTVCGDTSKAALKAHPVGGLIYFSQNLNDSGQVRDMLSGTSDTLRDAYGVAPFLAVDEEGGMVARVADNLGTTQVGAMQKVGDANDADAAYQVGVTIGNDIRQFGFNLDFAPVADINLNAGNELGDRIFSDDPEVVAAMASAVAEGIQSTGVAATLKHFPGLGAENGNAHDDAVVTIDRTLDDLRSTEFIPFKAGIAAGTDFVMVSHQVVTGVGDDLPSCLSPVVCTELLREELGFDGLIITDALNMNTISGTYDSGEAAVMALEAGVDILLMPEDFEAALQGVQDAVASGRISEERINESVNRILAEKQKLGLYDGVKSAPEEDEATEEDEDAAGE